MPILTELLGLTKPLLMEGKSQWLLVSRDRRLTKRKPFRNKHKLVSEEICKVAEGGDSRLKFM